jgi:hypothetical protein
MSAIAFISSLHYEDTTLSGYISLETTKRCGYIIIYQLNLMIEIIAILGSCLAKKSNGKVESKHLATPTLLFTVK